MTHTLTNTNAGLKYYEQLPVCFIQSIPTLVGLLVKKQKLSIWKFQPGLIWIQKNYEAIMKPQSKRQMRVADCSDDIVQIYTN